MLLKEIRGRKANINRWEALKQLDWVKDAEVIEWISKVTNPRFFSSRTPEDIVDYAKEAIEEKKFEEVALRWEEMKRQEKEAWEEGICQDAKAEA